MVDPESSLSFFLPGDVVRRINETIYSQLVSSSSLLSPSLRFVSWISNNFYVSLFSLHVDALVSFSFLCPSICLSVSLSVLRFHGSKSLETRVLDAVFVYECVRDDISTLGYLFFHLALFSDFDFLSLFVCFLLCFFFVSFLVSFLVSFFLSLFLSFFPTSLSFLLLIQCASFNKFCIVTMENWDRTGDRVVEL